MKAVLSWLREFAPIDGTTDELAEQLTNLGMELEEVSTIGGDLAGIVLAKVLDIRDHPDADRIRLVDVDAGDGQALQICCGASNMTVGDLVPLATIGAVMPGGMAIARRKMRGEVSNGMLCSAAELELGEDHSGILIIGNGDSDRLGQPIARILELGEDVVFDFDALPNRPDTLSMLGVARDIAAHQRLALSAPTPEVATVAHRAEDLASVAIQAPELCGRFCGLVVRGVKVGQSPRWMAQRLIAAGMRPINSVVDVSNYVMLELGQPTHTYDLAKLPNGVVSVRWARDGETITTLDDVERTLCVEDGVIVDGEDNPIGIAGVMGGASTEISDATTDILIEAAWWQPGVIAASAERLNLHSEASLRFKRGVDHELSPIAALRVAELLAEVNEVELCAGMLEAVGELPTPATVEVSPERINALLGTSLSSDGMMDMLGRIGFESVPSGDGYRVSVPSWRPDSTIEADIAEEVARHFGMANIPKTVPISPHTGKLSQAQRDRRTLRSVLLGAGVSEAMPMPFLAPGDLESFGFSDEGYVLANPLVSEESVLRTTLLPGLVKAVAYNERHRIPGVRLFEMGRCFVPAGAPVIDVDESAIGGTVLPGESDCLGVVLAGAEAPEAVSLAEALIRSVWRWASTGATESLQPKAQLSRVDLLAGTVAALHPGRSARIVIDGTTVGAVGEIDPRLLSRHGVTQRVAWVELNTDLLLAVEPHEPIEVGVSTYPSSDIDLAFVVDEQHNAESVRRTIVEAALPSVTTGVVVVDVALFDVFQSVDLGAGHRSLAFHLRFQAPDRTLTDGEVAEVRSEIIRAVESAHGAKLRG